MFFLVFRNCFCEFDNLSFLTLSGPFVIFEPRIWLRLMLFPLVLAITEKQLVPEATENFLRRSFSSSASSVPLRVRGFESHATRKFMLAKRQEIPKGPSELFRNYATLVQFVLAGRDTLIFRKIKTLCEQGGRLRDFRHCST